MHDDLLNAGIAAGFGSAPQKDSDDKGLGEPGTISLTKADFEVLGELGRGGMGIVYEARQISLNRRVALKVLATSLGMTTKAVVRFRREAEAAAKLHHTNIVPIYSTGECDGIHFYAMELIEGPSLNLVIREMRAQREGQASSGGGDGVPVDAMEDTSTRSLPREASGAMPSWVGQTLRPEVSSESSASTLGDTSSLGGSSYFDNVAKMIADVADALDYAHDHGVVHRDIKPSNLLLSPDGRLSINDFGLARMMELPGMTMTGEFMGSPLYMSPEQIAVGRAPLDHRTDIYSLGATLYELLTLQPPFPGEHRDQVIAQIMHKEPRQPRRINRRVPVDLETICLKAMEKDPDQRYQTAGALAEDLGRYINRFGIAAKRTSPVGRVIRWTRRRPAVASLLALLLIAVGALGVIAWKLTALQLVTAQESATTHTMTGNFAAAEQAVEQAESFGASHGWVRLQLGHVAFQKGQYTLALEHLEQAQTRMPESTAVYGLLTVAYGAEGEEEEGMRLASTLIEMPAESFEDKLFKGMGLAWFYPTTALENLNEAIEMRPSSSVAYLIRSRIHRDLAMRSGDIDDVERAIDDATTALSLLRDNPKAISTHLLAQLVRANILEEAGDEPGRSAAMDLAAKDAEKLAAFPNNADAREALIFYFGQTGDFDKALDVLSAAVQEGDPSDRVYRCANAWFKLGNHDAALAAYEEARGKTKELSWFISAYIRIEMGEDRTALLEEFAERHELLRASSAGPYQLMDWTVFRLLGNEDRALEVARHYREAMMELGGEDNDQWLAIAEYLNRDATAEDTLAKCESNRFPLSYALYVMGMDALGNGDRLAAEGYFRKCVENDVFYYFAYDWSQAFLQRLKQDPNWPSWIPPR